jgi:SAM-dependent methyltransferase
MQAYGHAFAYVYNLRWGFFARQVAPRLLAFYAATPAGQARQPVLDLCCGTGQLALACLAAGYPVTGLDLSGDMLAHAAGNAAAFVASGQARFVPGDAAGFELGQRFGLVVSTFDALNHLPDFDALHGCFRSVQRHLVAGGYFVFDLNTRLGLRRWNNITVDDSDEALIINRGFYDGESDRAWVKISGFVRTPAGAYERFDETVYNTVFPVAAVLAALDTAGLAAYPARLEDLSKPIEEPEAEGRVFIVARLGPARATG